MEEEDDPIFMESRLFPSETEGEKRRYLCTMTRSSFFDGQVGLNLCPKKCLTTTNTVMCVCGGGGGGGGWCVGGLGRL